MRAHKQSRRRSRTRARANEGSTTPTSVSKSATSSSRSSGPRHGRHGVLRSERRRAEQQQHATRAMAPPSTMRVLVSATRMLSLTRPHLLCRQLQLMLPSTLPGWSVWPCSLQKACSTKPSFAQRRLTFWRRLRLRLRRRRRRRHHRRHRQTSRQSLLQPSMLQPCFSLCDIHRVGYGCCS